MATKYPKDRSPYWYLQFIDKDGIRRNQSSGLRCDNPKQTAEADVLVAQLTSAEVSRGLHGGTPEQRWEFVPKFLKDHCGNAGTYKRYANRAPENVTFASGQDYLDWRTAYKKKSGKSVCRNTAIMEVKLFSQIMQQAMRLKLCTSNPLVRLGMRKDHPAKKPEITEEEFAIILPALANEPEWMQVSWQIAMHTGCRLSDTKLPMRQIDFAEDRITFETPKGGEDFAFSVPIPSALRPFLLSLRDGRKTTLEFPFQPSRQWQHFFRRVGLPHLTFHCTRVTFITRLARKGVPLAAAMRLVNHASSTIHRIYQRLDIKDVRQYAETAFPGQLPMTVVKQETTTSRRRRKTPATVSAAL